VRRAEAVGLQTRSRLSKDLVHTHGVAFFTLSSKNKQKSKQPLHEWLRPFLSRKFPCARCDLFYHPVFTVGGKNNEWKQLSTLHRLARTSIEKQNVSEVVTV
jgi:hypothetical protein